jgi:hypothetical protein
MCYRGVLVHCPSRLGAAVAVQAAELLCGDGVFTKRTLEPAKAVHHCDGVVSHSFKYSLLSWYDSELKLPAALARLKSRYLPTIPQLVHIGCSHRQELRREASLREALLLLGACGGHRQRPPVVRIEFDSVPIVIRIPRGGIIGYPGSGCEGARSLR